MAQKRTTRRTARTARTSPSGSTRGMEDAVSLLKADHEKVSLLFEQLEKTTERGAAKRQKLVAQIEAEIKAHMAVEEEIFYPAFRDAVTKKDDKEMYFEAKEEHHVADTVLSELKGLDPTDETYAAKAKVLKELIEHHVEEEEGEMFPKARRAMGAARLRELGEEMGERKRDLQQRERTAVGRLARTMLQG